MPDPYQALAPLLHDRCKTFSSPPHLSGLKLAPHRPLYPSKAAADSPGSNPGGLSFNHTLAYTHSPSLKLYLQMLLLDSGARSRLVNDTFHDKPLRVVDSSLRLPALLVPDLSGRKSGLSPSHSCPIYRVASTHLAQHAVRSLVPPTPIFLLESRSRSRCSPAPMSELLRPP